MSGESGRHEAVAGELAEWWEDLCGGIGSRVVLLAVPPAWGRSAVLDKFRADDHGIPYLRARCDRVIPCLLDQRFP